MKLEAELMKQVSQRLKIYNMTGEVVWFSRLQSGKVRQGLYFIKLCDLNTPDYLALVRMVDNSITALFIECKSDTGRLTVGQADFAQRYNRQKDFHVMCLRDIKNLDNWINKYAINKVHSLPNNLEDLI